VRENISDGRTDKLDGYEIRDKLGEVVEVQKRSTSSSNLVQDDDTQEITILPDIPYIFNCPTICSHAIEYLCCLLNIRYMFRRLLCHPQGELFIAFLCNKTNFLPLFGCRPAQLSLSILSRKVLLSAVASATSNPQLGREQGI
jgi:hypothetical protein